MTDNEAFLEKIKTIGVSVKNGTPKFFHSRSSVSSMFEANDARRFITKDRSLYKHIREGNASDPSITRDVTAFENDKKMQEKRKAREVKAARVKKLKDEYRRKYKSEA